VDQAIRLRGSRFRSASAAERSPASGDTIHAVTGDLLGLSPDTWDNIRRVGAAVAAVGGAVAIGAKAVQWIYTRRSRRGFLRRRYWGLTWHVVDEPIRRERLKRRLAAIELFAGIISFSGLAAVVFVFSQTDAPGRSPIAGAWNFIVILSGYTVCIAVIFDRFRSRHFRRAWIGNLLLALIGVAVLSRI
jgi:hypothetical protein